MEVVTTGHRTSVPDSLKTYLSGKLNRLERLDPDGQRLELDLCIERNPRQEDRRDRVALTWWSGSRVHHAVASGATAYAALEAALAKLCRQLRAAHERARVHHGRRTPATLRREPAAVDPQMRDDSHWLALSWFGPDRAAAHLI